MVITLNYNEMLTDIRKDHNIFQRDLATILNVSKSTYARWETKEQIIPLNHLNDFCNYFNVSMDYVMNLSRKNNNHTILEKLDKKIIGSNLKKIRKDLSLTQEDIASLLNTSHSTISAYESGKTLILTSFAYQICQKYNISMDWLCGRVKN